MSECRRKTVLYVEDNLVNVYLVQAIFEARANIDLLTAIDGVTGLDFARQHHPDLILLDLNLPDMDGEGYLKQLRAEASTAKIPVIIVSADALHDHRHHCLGLGVVDYITKPFDLNEFEAIVDRTLGINA